MAENMYDSIVSRFMDLAMSAISSFWKLLLTIRRGFYYNNSKYILGSVIIFWCIGSAPSCQHKGKEPGTGRRRMRLPVLFLFSIKKER